MVGGKGRVKTLCAPLSSSCWHKRNIGMIAANKTNPVASENEMRYQHWRTRVSYRCDLPLSVDKLSMQFKMLVLLSKVPLSVLHALAGFGAFVAFYVIRYRPRSAYENISYALPELNTQAQHELVKAYCRNAADVLVETIKAYGMSKEMLTERVRITNIDVLDRFVRANQSIILLGTHVANWEWVFLSCSIQLPFVINAVYKPMRNVGLNAFLLATRSRFGASLFTPDEALRVLVKSGDKLRAISLVVDHVPASKDEAHWVQFLNREASCVVGFEKLARLRQYPVVLASRRRTRRGHYEVTFEILGEPPYDSQSFYLVERYMASLEQSIKANPADWLWNYRRWRNKKPFYA